MKSNRFKFVCLCVKEQSCSSHEGLTLSGEVEMVADAVENAAEIVEKVATVTEKVSSRVADRLPEDAKLKNAALLVEHAAKEAAEEAHLAKDIIHKVYYILR